MRGAVPTIIEFTCDPDWLGLSVSLAQGALLKVIDGLELTADERDVYRLCTGREAYEPGHPFGEVTVIAGARSGKDSRILAPVICREATLGGHEQYLAKGEGGLIPLVALDQRGVRVAFTYVRDYFLHSPLLRQMVEDEPLAYELRLTNRMTIFAFPCTQRSLRSFSIPAGGLDEVGWYPMEGAADSDTEIQISIRRGMLGFPHPRLVKISTPHMRSGLLYTDFQASWGRGDPDRLVWKASTALMNPSITPERLERERRLDPSRFEREYGAEFSEDLEAFLPAAWVDEAVMVGVHELPPGPA